MNGQSWGMIALTFISSNGWWYCATQQNYVGETHWIIVPIFSTIFLVGLTIKEIVENWD